MYLFTYLLSVCVHTYRCSCVPQGGSILSFHLVGSRNQAQAVRLGRNLLSHLAGPRLAFKRGVGGWDFKREEDVKCALRSKSAEKVLGLEI